MKNTIKLFGIIAMVAIIGLSMAACGEAKDEEPNVTVQNLSSNTVSMELVDSSGDNLSGPKEVGSNKQWELTGCPVKKELTVKVTDSGSTYKALFTLAKKGDTKTLKYKGGTTDDDFTAD